ncbi:hypothetical protein RIF29_29569 [Crotalaria pallida]|uniref:Uncharacterized protein n=1 Tax=Crotalaria pallida TaxID=3830 RepID=A0AAN9HWD4_CROPI
MPLSELLEFLCHLVSLFGNEVYIVCDSEEFAVLCYVLPKQELNQVDLRCHGDSASIKKRGPHTVQSAALNVLKLVRVLYHVSSSYLYRDHAVEWENGSINPNFIFVFESEFYKMEYPLLGHLGSTWQLLRHPDPSFVFHDL